MCALCPKNSSPTAPSKHWFRVHWWLRYCTWNGGPVSCLVPFYTLTWRSRLNFASLRYLQCINGHFRPKSGLFWLYLFVIYPMKQLPWLCWFWGLWLLIYPQNLVCLYPNFCFLKTGLVCTAQPEMLCFAQRGWQAASGYDVVVCPPNWVQFPEPFPGRLSYENLLDISWWYRMGPPR